MTERAGPSGAATGLGTEVALPDAASWLAEPGRAVLRLALDPDYESVLDLLSRNVDPAHQVRLWALGPSSDGRVWGLSIVSADDLSDSRSIMEQWVERVTDDLRRGDDTAYLLFRPPDLARERLRPPIDSASWIESLEFSPLVNDDIIASATMSGEHPELGVGDSPPELHRLADQLRSGAIAQSEALHRQWLLTDVRPLDEVVDYSAEITKVLGGIASRMADSARLRDELQALAERARQLDLSWTVIAKAAGVTQQTAHRRWDPEAREKHAAYQRDRRAAK